MAIADRWPNSCSGRSYSPMHGVLRSRISRLTLLISFGFVAPVFAQDGSNVLLVVNQASSVSEAIGAHYAGARDVPPDNILRLMTATDDEIDRARFEREIERPISDWIIRHTAQDRILYIVLTKGVPLRVQGTGGLSGSTASVDSELTLLYRKLLGFPIPITGRIPNPYFHGNSPLTEAKPFSHATHDIYLVSRLDGFTVGDVLRLIDRGAAPVREGAFVLDQKATAVDPGGDAWLKAAATELTAAGLSDRVILDSSRNVVTGRKQVLGYYSWGSNDPAITTRHLDLGFVPGALAAMFVSSDGRTFKEPPESWNIGSWNDRKTYFEGSPQSLAGDFIRDGATGVAGHVAEPFLDSTIKPQILFAAYVNGFDLIESFYLAMPYLSWQTVVVGDPLCAPFRTQMLTRDHAVPDLDPETELPKFFSQRRLAMLAARGIGAQASALLLKGDTRLGRGDRAGAREPLEMATALDTRLNTAHLNLASMYELAGEYDRAIERYRQILTTAPDEPRVLNNLAYALAVRKAAPTEALPFAEKAYKLSNGHAVIADTLGWIHHLLGNVSEAEKLLAQAVAGAPENPDIHVHLAQVHAGAGRPDAAIAELDKAVALDPTLSDRDEIKALRAKIRALRQ